MKTRNAVSKGRLDDKMLRVVFDTNHLVSALISPHGKPAKILNAWKRGEVLLLVSEAILKEARRVLAYPKIRKTIRLSEGEIDDFMVQLSKQGLLVPAEIKVRVIEDDPSDDKFLSCAVEGKADYLVSGDKHLKALKEYRGVRIVSPGAFLSILKSRPE